MIGMDTSGRPHRRGFTLVELLVVVGVLVVLVAILMPTMGRMREQGRRAHCLNNLRQLAITAIAYASDDDDGYFILPRDDNQGDSFEAWYPKYVTDLKIFVCPSTANVVRAGPKNGSGVPVDLLSNAAGGASDARGGHSYELRNWYWTGVTFPDGVSFQNHSHTGGKVPKRLKGGSNVKSSRIMLITDGDDSIQGDQNNWPDKLPNGSTNDNHGAQGFNCAFLDGRAEWLPVGKPVLQAYMDGYYDPNLPSHIINPHGLYKSGSRYEWK